jgi:hypothetical protein
MANLLLNIDFKALTG